MLPGFRHNAVIRVAVRRSQECAKVDELSARRLPSLSNAVRQRSHEAKLCKTSNAIGWRRKIK